MLLQFSYIFWALLCIQVYRQFWRIFHEMLRKEYIFLCECEILCKYGLDLWYNLDPAFLCYVFVCNDLSIGKSGVGYWSYLLSLCEGQCVISHVVVSLLWTYMPVHLVYNCLELQYSLGGFVLWWAYSKNFSIFILSLDIYWPILLFLVHLGIKAKNICLVQWLNICLVCVF